MTDLELKALSDSLFEKIAGLTQDERDKVFTLLFERMCRFCYRKTAVYEHCQCWNDE